MTNVNIKEKAEAVKELLDLTKNFQFKNFQLMPTWYPYAVGNDNLAKKCIELLKILKQFNLSPDNIVRNTDIHIYFGDDHITLEQSEWGEVLLWDSVVILDRYDENENPIYSEDNILEFTQLLADHNIICDYFYDDLNDDDY